jgi:hypothetical protein
MALVASSVNADVPPNPNTKPSNLMIFSAVSYSEEEHRKISKERLAADNTTIGCR